MNKKQWYVLSGTSYFLAIIFMFISTQWRNFCLTFTPETFNTLEACVRSHIFAPYPYIFLTLGVVFIILAFLEPKKK